MRTARCAGQAARSSPARARSSALITRTRACWRASSSSGKQRRRSTMSRAMEKVMSSAQPSRASQQTDLAEAVRDLVTAMEKQAQRLGHLEAAIEKLEKELSTSTSTADSTLPSELRSLANAQSEMSKTLAEIGKTVSDERVVKTSDGETVSASQLSAHSLVSRLEKQIAVMSSSSAELAEAVRKRGRVVIDMGRLEKHVAGMLDQRLELAVEGPVARLEKTVGGRIEAVSAESREAGNKAEAASRQLARSIEASSARIEKTRKVGWPEVGKLAAALLPLAVAVVLVLGFGRVMVVDVLGLPTVTAWLWSQVAGAGTWWQSALWGLGLFAVLAGTVALITWASRRLRSEGAH